jgi:hypothetical protein
MPTIDKNLEYKVRENLAKVKNIDPSNVSKEEAEAAAGAAYDAIEAYKKDTQFFRYVISFLFIIVIVVVIGVIYLLFNSKTQTDGLISIGSVAVGALAAIFVKTK